MTIYKIKFKRTKESKWESGINIEAEPGCILSKTGEVFHEIYDWEPMTADFCIDLTPILKD